MTQPDDRTQDGTDSSDGGDVNLQPGPRDEGGSGGMATREQEAREEQADGG